MSISGTIPLSSLSTFREIRQECSLKVTLIALFKKILWPFVSIYSGLSNLCLTGYWLTTSRVLEPMDINYHIPGTDSKNLPALRQAIGELKNGSYLSFHIGCQKLEKHSTMLLFGKTDQGTGYALFFDPRGSHPNRVRLMEKEFEIEKRHPENEEAVDQLEQVEFGFCSFETTDEKVATMTLNTLGELYREIVRDMPNPPKLLYTRSNIQFDHVSCTAYTAAFFRKWIVHVKTEGFNPEHIMQDVANQKFISFREARREVHNLKKALNQSA